MKDLVNKAVICWKFFKNVLYQDVNIFFSHLLIVSKIGNPLIKNNRPKSYLFFIFILSSFLQVNIFAQTVPATNSLQSISAGGFHTCGITNDTNKSLYCWGYNNDGQLGNNSTTRSLVPVQVLGGA